MLDVTKSIPSSSQHLLNTQLKGRGTTQEILSEISQDYALASQATRLGIWSKDVFKVNHMPLVLANSIVCERLNHIFRRICGSDCMKLKENCRWKSRKHQLRKNIYIKSPHHKKNITMYEWTAYFDILWKVYIYILWGHFKQISKLAIPLAEFSTSCSPHPVYCSLRLLLLFQDSLSWLRHNGFQFQGQSQSGFMEDTFWNTGDKSELIGYTGKGGGKVVVFIRSQVARAPSHKHL